MNNPLSDLFHVRGRFHRSVHLERDFYTDENVLEGYVVTATAREVLGRIVSALENNESSKAWSLTGPYGSGKSAFALFAANLLGDLDSTRTEQALSLLKQGDRILYNRLTNLNGKEQTSSLGFCPVLISGERAPISLAILQGLQQGLISFNGISKTCSSIRQINSLLKTAENGKLPQVSEIIKLFESATQQVKRHKGAGILLVIDELGKFLEYASQDPTKGDVFILQALAEIADRSTETPLFLLTILHQAFDMYAKHAAISQREEWAKVQGRFEDVPFTEPVEQVLRLVGTALDNRTNTSWNVNFNPVIELGLKTPQLDETELILLLEHCLPLHPIVALLIGPLFRQFGQNERSLFAFLSSSEPNGLQDFLTKQHCEEDILPLFSISDLYDYLYITQGNKLYTSSNSKNWVEIESAINRLPEPSKVTVKLIKVIGLLNITGEVITNLKASKKLLYYILDDNTKSFPKEFDLALNELIKNSIITYRSYNDTFIIWEGSDIDIDEKLSEAQTHVDTYMVLENDLSRYLPTQYLVARRHLFETGTLRYFTVRYTNLDNFEMDLIEPYDADGLILYTLPASEHEADQLCKKAEKTTEKGVLIAIPGAIGSLREKVIEVARLRWIQQNTPELQKDDIARREFSTRLLEVETDVRKQLRTIFDEDNENACFWYYKGKKEFFRTFRERNVYLSEICQQIYNKTPIFRNELINRRQISGTVTAARRELIQAMVESGDKENLGIKRNPPEMSIYQSLLLKTGIHRCETDLWGFHPPKKRDKSKIYPTWQKIEKFLTACESKRQPIELLYKGLRKPPYGVRNGPLPILLCAAMLCYRSEVALYENGSFVPDLSMPVFERLLKAPDKFELKRFQMIGQRTNVLVKYLNVIEEIIDFSTQSPETVTPNLLTIATPLMVFVNRLPKYTLQTQSLSKNAKDLCKTVIEAREPDRLLFHDLPKSVNCVPLCVETDINPNTVQFFRTLRRVLVELKQAYPSLLDFIEQQLASNFSIEYKNERLRKELIDLSKSLQEVTSGTQLMGFITRICDNELKFKNWLEAIAAFVINKLPSSWNDTDKVQFEIKLSQLIREFQHFEVISYERRKLDVLSGTKPIRIGTTIPNRDEQEQVVTLLQSNEKQANEMVEKIQELIEDLDKDKRSKLRLWVLAQIVNKEMQREEEYEKNN